MQTPFGNEDQQNQTTTPSQNLETNLSKPGGRIRGPPPGFLVHHQSFENVRVPAPPRKLSGLSLATSSKLLSAAAFAPRRRRAGPAAHGSAGPGARPRRSRAAAAAAAAKCHPSCGLTCRSPDRPGCLPPPRPGSPVPLPAELRRTGAAATSGKGRSVPCQQRRRRRPPPLVTSPPPRCSCLRISGAGLPSRHRAYWAKDERLKPPPKYVLVY